MNNDQEVAILAAYSMLQDLQAILDFTNNQDEIKTINEILYELEAAFPSIEF